MLRRIFPAFLLSILAPAQTKVKVDQIEATLNVGLKKLDLTPTAAGTYLLPAANCLVFRNGLLQTVTEDYTPGTGNTITFTPGITVGRVSVVYLG